MTVEIKPKTENQSKKAMFQLDIVTLYKVAMRIAPLLPMWLGNGLCDFIGNLAFWLVKGKREAVLSNLRHVFYDKSAAELRQIGRGIFKSNIRNYYDIFRVHALNPSELEAQVEILGLEHCREGKRLGKGTLCFAAHMGSFSFVTRVATRSDLDFHLVVEPIKPPELYELIGQQRTQDPRAHIIPVGGVEVRNIIRAIKRNEYVCLAIDRDVIGSGQPLEFFGATAKLPLGVAELALKTGAYCQAVHPYRRPDGTSVVRFYPGFTLEATGDKEAAIRNGAARMLREIEKIIRTTPQDWVVLAPIWD